MGPLRRDRGLAAAALLLWLPVAWSGAARAGPGWTAGGWLTAAAGSESDVSLDPGPTPSVVPGGPFLAAIGGVNGHVGSARGLRLNVGAQAWYEHFTDAGQRALFTGTVVSDLELALGRRWTVRLGAGGHHFDDSVRTTLRRLTGWSELGLAWQARRWRLEVQAGLEGRRFPRFTAPDAAGALGTYTEAQTSFGTHASVRAARPLVLRAAWHRRATDARDPYYDNDGTAVEAGADLLLGGGVRFLVDGFFQERTFTGRAAGTQRDRYRQAGCGVEVALGRGWQLRGTAAVTRYTWPEGTSVNTHRYQAALVRLLGAAARRGLPAPDRLLRDNDPRVPRAGRPILFRLHAPDARQVSLVGAFNGWDPAADPLVPAGGGWWQTSRALPAGTHAYAYVVDGTWRTPPQAEATEPDGFGGRNGLLVVLP